MHKQNFEQYNQKNKASPAGSRAYLTSVNQLSNITCNCNARVLFRSLNYEERHAVRLKSDGLAMAAAPGVNSLKQEPDEKISYSSLFLFYMLFLFYFSKIITHITVEIFRQSKV